LTTSATSFDMLLSKDVQEKVKVGVNVVSTGDWVQSCNVENIGIGPSSGVQEIVGRNVRQLELHICKC
jgi:hypothetical protein